MSWPSIMNTRFFRANTDCAVIAAMALMSFPIVLASQTVGGTVRVSEGAPLAGATVLLVDESGNVAAGAMTQPDGRFRVTAPHAGTYHVRTRHIGFAPDTSKSFRLESHATVAHDPVLSRLTLALEAVRVVEAERCVTSQSAGALALRLWEATQDALAGTVTTSMDQDRGYVLRRFERELDAATSRVRRSREWTVRTHTAEPYVSIAPESLATYGFTREEAAGTTFYAPDARTLTSDAFARTHCLRPMEDARRPELIGLAFEPASAQRAGDVEGVLWIDRASTELRSLEYRYLRQLRGPQDPVREVERPSGVLEYTHLPSGAWIVRRWTVRVPVLDVRPMVTATSVDATGRSIAMRATLRANVVRIWEFGGDVERAQSSSGADNLSGAVGVVRGSVVDSASERGIANVVITLTRDTMARDTTARDAVAPPLYTTTTAADGTFAFDSVSPAPYRLRVAGARLDTLLAVVAPTRVDVAPATRTTLTVSVPSAMSWIAMRCPSAKAAEEVTLHGTVRDSVTGAAAPGARVLVTWITSTLRTEARLTATPHEAATFSDSSGHYVMCGLPRDRRLLVQAALGNTRKTPYTPALEPRDEIVRMQDLWLVSVGGAGARAASWATSAVGSLVGLVTDSAGHPLPDAEITVLAPHHVTRSGAEGAYRIPSLPSGAVVVRVRRLGYQPVLFRVSLAAGEARTVNVALSRAAHQLETVAVEAQRDPANSFAERARVGLGSYVSAADIRRRRPNRTSDLLRALPGVSVSRGGSMSNSRGAFTLTPGATEGCPDGFRLFIDGAEIAGGMAEGNLEMLNSVPPEIIKGIELYRTGTSIPAMLPASASNCGAIFVWTDG